VIIGKREQSRSVDGISQRVVKSLGWVGDKLGQDAEVIPRAAVKAAELAKEGKAPEKFWVGYCASGDDGVVVRGSCAVMVLRGGAIQTRLVWRTCAS